MTLDKKFIDQFVNVTVKAAIAASHLVGKNDKNAADQAAVDSMRTELNKIDMAGEVVIGEGSLDEAPMLYTGELLGNKKGPSLDIAVDPVEGTNFVANNLPGGIAVLAIAEQNNLFNAPETYMNKIATGKIDKGLIDLDFTIEKNIKNLSNFKNKDISSITACILNRPRHKKIIDQLKDLNVKIKLITDGDVLGALFVSDPKYDVDIFLGIGGGPEGVLAASALDAYDCHFQGRLIFDNDQDVQEAKKMGIEDLNKKYELKEIVKGDSIFCATGITDSKILDGIKFNKNEIISETLVTHKSSSFKKIIKKANLINEWYLFQKKKWIEKKINKNSIEKIKQDFHFSEIVSKLIISRNFDHNEIYSIKNPSIIVNEFKKDKDFINATSLLEKSINKKELICIFGDYDVDGSTATSLLAKFFNHIKQPYFFYIPDRERDGYGPSISVFKELILKKPKLIIMVDCGSTSNQSVAYLNTKKIKSIIIDHHEINKPYPKTNVLINPKKNINNSSKDYYCATTLTYFFLEIMIKNIKSSFNLSNYLIYVLLALVCDVMPLRKINRNIALNLVKNFKIKDNILFKTLYELYEKKNNLTIEDLGFFIGPIINSGGRLSSSQVAADLLISENIHVVKEKSLELIKLNNIRKDIENKILNEINFEKLEKEDKDVIIYYNSKIKEGLIGIIASRLKDYFNKPSIVITATQNILKGSARSTVNYNVGNVIQKLIDKKLIESGGGHNMAAGFSMKKDKVKDLEDFILDDFAIKNKKLNLNNTYDAEVSPNVINKDFTDEINKIGPFGCGNPTPIFLIKNLKVVKARIINNKHLNVMLKPRVGKLIKSICFNSLNTQLGRYLLSYKKNIHVVAQIHENYWNNNKYLQLNIKDLFIELN